MNKQSLLNQSTNPKSVEIVNKSIHQIRLDFAFSSAKKFDIKQGHPTFSSKYTLSIALDTNPRLEYSLKAGVLSG
ncbi:hypothetical protein CLV31_12139 [Algoriphagus aquaeductus]|uniref:Uncharacterized protein n=1 Tax=Algoriphagus aquaeductus TaxID=475299 RepID=A0A326RVH7_9BACT|nr:hypothetical protein CLV31_12139 [Algoriphagus aquaeductus]